MKTTMTGLLLATVALGQGCATTTTRTRMWSENEGSADWERPGHVAWIRETVRDTHGNPGAGAASGAVVGGLLGAVLTGRGLGALIGATGGAMVGAAQSQGDHSDVYYDVLVRFDDGRDRVFRYHGIPPFRPGQPVSLTPSGLMARAEPAGPPHTVTPAPAPHAQAQAAPPASAPADMPPAPPPVVAPNQAAQAPTVPEGEWVQTRQYGWVWMPYNAEYTYEPEDSSSSPAMYVYYPAVGWAWVAAPWVWGWGPALYFGGHGGGHYGWREHPRAVGFGHRR